MMLYTHKYNTRSSTKSRGCASTEMLITMLPDDVLAKIFIKFLMPPVLLREDMKEVYIHRRLYDLRRVYLGGVVEFVHKMDALIRASKVFRDVVGAYELWANAIKLEPRREAMYNLTYRDRQTLYTYQDEAVVYREKYGGNTPCWSIDWDAPNKCNIPRFYFMALRDDLTHTQARVIYHINTVDLSMLRYTPHVRYGAEMKLFRTIDVISLARAIHLKERPLVSVRKLRNMCHAAGVDTAGTADVLMHRLHVHLMLAGANWRTLW